MSFIERLKSYYRTSEREAAKLAPYYVTGDGVMYAKPKEVLRSKKVQTQFREFESLKNEIEKKSMSSKERSAISASN